MQKELPEWFDEEAARAEEQAISGQAVNKDAYGGPVKPARRVNKAFQVEEGRVARWHLLVAMEKGKGRGHKSGPELIDEALDLLFEQYNV